jgi:fucose permease
MIAFWMGEKLGRKKTILVGTSIMSVGAILQSEFWLSRRSGLPILDGG